MSITFRSSKPFTASTAATLFQSIFEEKKKTSFRPGAGRWSPLGDRPAVVVASTPESSRAGGWPKKKRKEKKVPRFRVLVWTHWGSRVRFFFFVCVWSRPFLRPFSLWTCRLPCFLVFFSRDRCWSPFSFQVTRWRQKKNSKRQCDKKKALQEQHTKVTCDADPSVSSFDIRWAVENPVENPVEREEIYWTNENSPDMQGTKSKQPTVGSFHRFFLCPCQQCSTVLSSPPARVSSCWTLPGSVRTGRVQK